MLKDVPIIFLYLLKYLSALRAEPATVLSILVVAHKWGNSKINQKGTPKQLQKSDCRQVGERQKQPKIHPKTSKNH